MWHGLLNTGLQKAAEAFEKIVKVTLMLETDYAGLREAAKLAPWLRLPFLFGLHWLVLASWRRVT